MHIHIARPTYIHILHIVGNVWKKYNKKLANISLDKAHKVQCTLSFHYCNHWIEANKIKMSRTQYVNMLPSTLLSLKMLSTIQYQRQLDTKTTDEHEFENYIGSMWYQNVYVAFMRLKWIRIMCYMYHKKKLFCFYKVFLTPTRKKIAISFYTATSVHNNYTTLWKHSHQLAKLHFVFCLCLFLSIFYWEQEQFVSYINVACWMYMRKGEANVLYNNVHLHNHINSFNNDVTNSSTYFFHSFLSFSA